MSGPHRADGRVPRLAWGLLGLYAFALLSIGLTRDWRLRHEDNGAMHTSLALSHLTLGLAATRAHDVFYNPHTGEATPYGHHPPATALVLAAAFALTGSDSPAVARLTVIACHLGSLFVFTAWLGRFVGTRHALLGGFVFATLPMSAYFGRMVNYEPLCLCAILLQLYGYVLVRQGERRGYAWLVSGIVVGGLVDWPSFFFAAALALVELADLVRRRSRSRRLFVVLVIAAPATFAFDLWHLWYAGRGGVAALGSILSADQPLWHQDFTLAQFVFGQIDTYRRYFTHAGLVASAITAFCLFVPKRPLSRRLFEMEPRAFRPGDPSDAALLRRVLAASGGAALAYLLAAPGWARAHQYWQFYFLPSAVTSMVLGWRLLERAIRERRTAWLRVARVLIIVEVIASSGYWLYFRHTRVEAYTLEETARIRSTFLAPGD